MRDATERPEPFVRTDTKGKWRHEIYYNQTKKLLTEMSWNTKEQAEDWVRWNNFEEGIYGEIIRNPTP